MRRRTTAKAGRRECAHFISFQLTMTRCWKFASGYFVCVCVCVCTLFHSSWTLALEFSNVNQIKKSVDIVKVFQRNTPDGYCTNGKSISQHKVDCWYFICWKLTSMVRKKHSIRVFRFGNGNMASYLSSASYLFRFKQHYICICKDSVCMLSIDAINCFR